MPVKKILLIVLVAIVIWSAPFIKKTYMDEVKNSVSENTGKDEEAAGEKPELTPRIAEGIYKIVLDAGHGGIDPGKVSAGNILEKDINLSITKKLKALLEEEGIEAILTRDSDDALYEENDSNKKAADLKTRVRIIEEEKPELAVSIHQNSYTDPSSHGAQVFYYKGSPEGSEFALIMQNTLRELVDSDNSRQAKENTSYYLLKKTSVPIIIVECGFLSNPSEAALLDTEEYQDKMAHAIKEGIIRYLERKEHGDNS